MQESRRYFYIKYFYGLNAMFWLLLFLHSFILDIVSHYTQVDNTSSYPFQKVIYHPFGYYFTYWLASFFIVKFYLLSRNWTNKKFILAHLIVGVLVAFLIKFFTSVVVVLLERLFLPTETMRIELLWQQEMKTWWDIFIGIFNYVLFCLGLLGLDVYNRYKNHFIWYSEMESKLISNQLQTLKMQLKPHFLFNALNTIAMMVRREKSEKAVEMIVGLSDMLRSSLSSESRQFVTLKEELDLLKKYLAIEEMRYQDRLQLVFNISSETLPCQIPNLLLQPIVENAFKHGIASSMQTEEIRISSKLQKEQLQIDVFNTGSSLPPDWTMVSSKGIGIANTAQRLRQLYKENFKFLVMEEQGGVLVRIILPKK